MAGDLDDLVVGWAAVVTPKLGPWDPQSLAASDLQLVQGVSEEVSVGRPDLHEVAASVVGLIEAAEEEEVLEVVTVKEVGVEWAIILPV
jgi:hypothetical protein